MKDVLPVRLLDAAVGDLAAADLGACEFFDRAGLSFAEDGDRSVGDACRMHCVDASLLAGELASPGATAAPPGDAWSALDEMCRRVVRCHHGPLRVSLGWLRTCVSALRGQTETASPVLEEVYGRLERLTESLLVHFAKEENILFPAFSALAAAGQQNEARPPLPFATVMHPIRVMEVEHERIERELEALTAIAARRDLVRDTSDGDEFRQQLEGFRRALTAHAHFENDLLFARALEVERTIG